MSTQGAFVTDRNAAMGPEHEKRRTAALAELARVLARESNLVRDLREALVRQRAGVAADSTADVQGSCDDIARILVALDGARRNRAALLSDLVGSVPATLEELARALGGMLPPAVAQAGLALRREAESTAREAAVNRTVLQRTVEAGEAFLQALFTSTMSPDPVYHAGERRDDDGAGFLLDRTA